MSKYQELKEKASKVSMPGIFYAFSNQQFKEGLVKIGLLKENETLDDFQKKGIKITTDGLGGYGLKEAFAERRKQYDTIDEEIKANCTADEIFEYEWWNHECGLTYSYTEALEITREYFPEYTPSEALIKSLHEKFEKANCY